MTPSDSKIGSLLLHDLSSSQSGVSKQNVVNTTIDEKLNLPSHQQGIEKKQTELVEIDDLNPTSSTTALIVLIHIIWIYQWNFRKRPSKVNYRTIVHKREYHNVCLGILSHPPTKNYRRRNNHQHHQSPTNALQDTTATSTTTPAPTSTTATVPGGVGASSDGQQDIRSQIKQLLSWAHQSGFGLLLYNSHIVWSCRSLEALYVINQGQDIDSLDVYPHYKIQPQQYARVLFALASIALLLELRFSFNLLRISRKFDNSTSNSTNRMQQKILQRPVGSLTALSSAIIVVFHGHFAYISLQVIPFVDNRLLLLGFRMPVFLSSLSCLGILGYLSYPHFPITPVFCGLASGSLWAVGLTSFLQEQYWGNSVIFAFLLLCILSIKERNSVSLDGTAAPSQPAPTYIPCVDFVSPSYSGREASQVDHQPPAATSGNYVHFEHGEESSDDSDESTRYTEDPEERLDDDDASSIDLEMAPLLGRGQMVRARRGASTG